MLSMVVRPMAEVTGTISTDGNWAVFFLESIHGQAYPGNDIAAHELAVAGNCTHGRRRTKVDHDEIAIRIKFDCADRVRNSIRPNLFGILIADAQPGLDTRAHDQRVEIEVLLTARSEGVKHVRHHRTAGDAFDAPPVDPVLAQGRAQEDAELVGGRFRRRGGAELDFQGVVVKHAAHDLGVSDIETENHGLAPLAGATSRSETLSINLTWPRWTAPQRRPRASST